MLKLTRTLLTSLPLSALPAMAADVNPVPTGITSVAPSLFIFTVAAAVLLTLVFRASSRHLSRYLESRAGRHRIRRALRLQNKHVMDDFLLAGAYGGLARIDHAVLTTGGILCIRALHGSGTVTGDENEPQWTIVDGATRRRFLNPLIQNEGRTRAMRKALPDVPIANLVVFTGKVKFAATPAANVIHLSRIESYIARYVFGPSRIADWDAVWLTLSAAVLKDAETRKDFDAQISFS